MATYLRIRDAAELLRVSPDTVRRLLVDTLSGPFEPERYPDEHRQRLLEAIDARTPSAAASPSAPSPTRVMDLMAALEASVKAARAARADQERPAKSTRRRSSGA